jgi:hypothetical protein
MILFAAEYAIRHFPQPIGAAVIGSVVEGDHDECSDCDFFHLGHVPVPGATVQDLKAACPGIDLVLYTPSALERQFTTHTTMAWAVSRGLVLWDGEGVFERLARHPLGLPSKMWVRQTARKVNAWSDDGQMLCRKVINLAILLVELHGTVPTTKTQLLREFRARPVLRDGVAGLEEAIGRLRSQDGWQGDDGKARLTAAAQHLWGAIELLCNDLPCEE